MSIKIGYKVSAEQFGPRDLVEFTVRAEEVGFDSAMISDHFLPWRLNGGHSPSALAWLGAVVERTSTIQVGTSVLTPTFRYNPAVLAQTFATLSLLSEGRVLLGVGTGEALNEIAVSGMTWPGYKERAGRLSEAIALMRDLWTGEKVSRSDGFYTLKDAQIMDVPTLPVPIYVAAGGPASARLAGRVGDGMICTSGKGASLYTDDLLPEFSKAAAAADKGEAGLGRLIEMKVSYDRDPELALSNTRFWAPLSLTQEQKHSIDSPAEMERAADELPIEQVAKRWIVSSDPEQTANEIQAYIDMGFDEVIVHGPGGDQLRFLDQFSTDVLPRIRNN